MKDIESNGKNYGGSKQQDVYRSNYYHESLQSSRGKPPRPASKYEEIGK